MQSSRGLLWLTLTLSLASCDRGSGPSAKASNCPACECEDTAATGDPYALVDVIAAANRKLMHGDGPGCLEELARIEDTAPTLMPHLVMTEAQCERLSGDCQRGKEKVAAFYEREMAMSPGLAAKTAESIAAMRCRGGDASERDRLLAAYTELQDAAYVNKRDLAFCQERVALIEQLAPKVEPRDAEDSAVTGGRQALFQTSAMCLARAGDCALAYADFGRLFPADALAAFDQLEDPNAREDTLLKTFRSSVALCTEFNAP